MAIMLLLEYKLIEMTDRLKLTLDKFTERQDDVMLNVLSGQLMEFYNSDQVNNILSSAEENRKTQILKNKEELTSINNEIDKIDPLIKEYNELKVKIDSRNEILSGNQSKIEELEFYKKESQNQIASKAEQIEKLQNTIKTNEEQISKIDKKLDKLNSHYKKYFEAQQEIFGAIGEDSRISSKIENLKSELDLKLSEMDNLLKELLPNYEVYDWDELDKRTT